MVSVSREEVCVVSRDDVEAMAGSLAQPLIRLAYLLTGDPDEAQDVVQAVFLKPLAGDLEDVRDLGAYARRAVVNEVQLASTSADSVSEVTAQARRPIVAGGWVTGTCDRDSGRSSAAPPITNFA